MKKLVCESLEELYEFHLPEFEVPEVEAPEVKYSGGEKAAITRGHDVLTKAQLAALYLAAKNAAGRSEDTRGRGDSGLTRNALKIAKEESTDFEKLSAPRLADVLDLKPRTVNYTLSKFRLLDLGNREGTESNHLYDKIIEAFDEFENMSPAEVYAIAAEAVNMGAGTERSDQYYDETGEQGRKYRQNIKERNHKIGVDAYSLYNSYRPLGDRATTMTIDKISQKYGLPASEIRQIVKAHLKNDPFLARKF